MRLIYPSKKEIMGFFRTHAGFHTVLRISELLIAPQHSNVQEQEWEHVREQLHELKADGFLLVDNEGQTIHSEKFASTPDKISKYLQKEKDAAAVDIANVKETIVGLLNDPAYPKRTFELLSNRLPTLQEDKLREVLVSIGAVKYSGRNNEELWGFDIRHRDSKFSKLSKQVDQIEYLKTVSPWGAEFQIWEDITGKTIKSLFGEDAFRLFRKQGAVVWDDDAYPRELEGRKKILEGLLANRDEYQPDSETKSPRKPPDENHNLFTPSIPSKVAEGLWVWRVLNQFIGKWIKNPLISGIITASIIVIVLVIVVKVAVIFTRDTGYFEYQPHQITYASASTSTPADIRILFQADVRNISSSPRYLRNFVGVIWNSRFLGNTWSYTYSNDVGEVYSVHGASTTAISLPLRFEPNETQTLQWRFKEDYFDEPEVMNFLSEKTCEGGFCWNKNSFDILVADSRGNIFNQQGALQSQPVIDTWWVYPHNQGNELLSLLDLLYRILIWKVVAFLPFLK